jgi:hypothetical protein
MIDVNLTCPKRDSSAEVDPERSDIAHGASGCPLT